MKERGVAESATETPGGERTRGRAKRKTTKKQARGHATALAICPHATTTVTTMDNTALETCAPADVF